LRGGFLTGPLPGNMRPTERAQVRPLSGCSAQRGKRGSSRSMAAGRTGRGSRGARRGAALARNGPGGPTCWPRGAAAAASGAHDPVPGEYAVPRRGRRGGRWTAPTRRGSGVSDGARNTTCTPLHAADLCLGDANRRGKQGIRPEGLRPAHAPRVVSPEPIHLTSRTRQLAGSRGRAAGPG